MSPWPPEYLILHETPSRWVAYAGGRLQSQDVHMGLEAIQPNIVDGLFGIESTSGIAYTDKELSSSLAVQECGL